MRYVIFVLTVAGLMSVLACILIRAMRPLPCPSCGHRRLRCINFIKATILVDGKRAPDWWAYYACPSCGAMSKHHRGQWSAVEDADRLDLERR